MSSGTERTSTTADFTTAVSRVAPGHINVRGYDARDLMHHASFSEGAFLTLTGRRPTRAELRVVDAILCSCLDHGLVNTLTTSARYVASGSASLPAAVATGVLCYGPYTGTPHLTAALLLELTDEHGVHADDQTIDQALLARRRRREPIPGLGHPIHRERDPREQTVREIAAAEGLLGPSVALLDRVRARCSVLVKRELVLNIDGLMAALFLDMGLAPQQMLALNILSAIPGIAAQAIEEMQSGRHLRYPADHEAAYTLPVTTTPWEGPLADAAAKPISPP